MGILLSGITTATHLGDSFIEFMPGGGSRAVSFYVDGPASGTWSATVRFWRVQGDGSLSLLASATLTNSGPNTDGGGTKTYDQISLDISGPLRIKADVSSVTGTIPDPGLFAEVN